MPFFVVHESGQPDRLAEIHTPEVVIGRGTDSDIVLPNVSVSRQHAHVAFAEDGCATVTTLADDNPVYDGESLLPMVAVVQHGRKVRIGRFGLTYLHEAHLDLFSIQQLTDMPRFAKRGANDAETHVLSATLQKRLMQIEIRRELGAFVNSGGNSFLLGAEAKAIGPSGDIPCPGRWGSGTAATVTWAGAQHQIERSSVFAKVQVNGEPHKQRMLEPGDTIDINGETFTYTAERVRKKKKTVRPGPASRS